MKALLVIDMLRDFLEEEGALCIGETKELRDNIKAKLDDWRKEDLPVIYIMDRHHPNDSEFQMFPPHCVAGEWGSEVVDEIAPQEGDYLIYKRRYSAFFGTELDLILRELGVTEIELVGVCTQICILYTAADARMRHYSVTVDRKLVSSFDSEAHEFALKEMENTLGVEVL